VTWRTHAAGGLSTLWILAQIPGAVSVDNLGILAGCAFIGSLMPDLDSRQAKIKNLGVMGINPFQIAGAAVMATQSHRGLLHSYLGMALLGTLFGVPILLYLGPVALIAFLLGYASHLALDCMTPVGLMLMWPSRERFWLLPRWLRITTGSDWEDLIFATLAMAVVLLLVRLALQGAQ